MIKYEQIAKANEEIKTTSIERKNKNGQVTVKEYAEVNQRIKAFRMVHPNGVITTDIISLENGIVLMKAQVMDDEDRVIGTGYAYEKEGSTFINQTSYIENCETSAVGRALGMCGFGIDASVASAEEVQNAMANQEQAHAHGQAQAQQTKGKVILATEKQIQIISEMYNKTEISKMLKNIGVKALKEITIEQASKMIASRKEKKDGTTSTSK